MPKTGQTRTKKSVDYEVKHGEQITREDYNKYKESFVKGTESYDLAKPLSFKDYRDIAMFRGKKATENADLSTVAKTGLDADKYRAKKKASTKNNLSGGGMPTKNYVNPVTVTDNRKKKR